MHLFTIGFTKSSAESFFTRLQTAGVERLIDVRLHNVSQLAGFAKAFGTAEPFGLTCMSATMPEGRLETADNPERGDVVRILTEERTGELEVRLGAA